MKSIADKIRDIPDFPKKGIIFKDITPLLSDIETLRTSVKEMAAPYMDLNVDVVVGIESRGFIFGAPIADILDCSFVPVRKPGKLPWKTESVSYELEYGDDSLEIHTDAIEPHQNVLIVDDLLATGGTLKAAAELVEKCGATVVGMGLVIELNGLGGRGLLDKYNLYSLVQY